MAKAGGEKLTMKNLSGEMDALRAQVRELQQQLERKLESSLEKVTEKLKARVESAGRNSSGPAVNAATRRQMIAEQAWLRAEARGFQGGDPQQDWLEAEKEVNSRLMQ